MTTDESLRYRLLSVMNLSENEKAVLAVLKKQKLARNVSEIARDAGIPRTTASYILKKFLKWRLAKCLRNNKRPLWKEH